MPPNSQEVAIKDVGKFKDYFTSFVFAPGQQIDSKSVPKHARKRWKFHEKVKRFEDSFTVWNMEYGQLLAKGKNAKVSYGRSDADSPSNAVDAVVNDSGYAVLSLLNPYIEVIGRLSGDFPNFPYWVTKPKECISEGKLVEAGILFIIPELKKLEIRKRRGVLTLFRMAVRNSMAHTYFTGTNVTFSRHHEQIILVGTLRNKRAISINPEALFERGHTHFKGYVEKLKMQNPPSEVKQLQERFNERYPDGLKMCRDR